MGIDLLARPAEIFLAEDNPADVYLIRQALEERQLSHRLHVAEDGEKAALYLTAIGRDGPCPDIVVLDLSLPKQDGQELLQLFRNNPDCSEKPVIVMSSSDSPKDQELTKRLGATFFKKPADLEAFCRIADLIASKLAS
ncbi:MAG: response regulator [Acidobacteriota bacterium]|nr:response regulator [Acidobacteriota bacterium]